MPYTYASYMAVGALTSSYGHMDGKVDEVRVYNRALSAQEIQDLYNTSTSLGTTALVRSNHDICTGITSKVTATSMPPTITLLSVEADVGADSNVTLTWETAKEIDNAVFNLYRARRRNGTYTQINNAPINAKGDTVSGISYSFMDTPQRRGTYYYKIGDANYNRATTMHGPVKVRVKR